MQKTHIDKTNLAYLQKLTRKLPSLAPFAKEQDTSGGIVRYKMLDTTEDCISVNLYNIKEISIKLMKIPKGHFPAYSQPVQEIIILISGRIIHNMGGERKEIFGNNIIIISPETVHDYQALQDSELISILIPNE